MSIGVGEAAQRLGVSRQRVLAMVHGGDIPAQREGRDWRIDPSDLPKRARQSRALSERMARALIALSSDPSLVPLSGNERARALGYLDRLGRADDPASLLRAWMRARAERQCFRARDLEFLRGDPRIAPSGVSSPVSGLSSAGFVEGYVRADDLKQLVRDHMLASAPSAHADVVLHVAQDVSFDSAPPLLVAADLADHENRFGREDEQVREIVESISHVR